MRELVFNTPNPLGLKEQVLKSPSIKELGGVENLGVYHQDVLNGKMKNPRDLWEVQALSERNMIFLPDQNLGNQTKKMTKQQLLESRKGEVSKI